MRKEADHQTSQYTHPRESQEGQNVHPDGLTALRVMLAVTAISSIALVACNSPSPTPSDPDLVKPVLSITDDCNLQRARDAPGLAPAPDIKVRKSFNASHVPELHVYEVGKKLAGTVLLFFITSPDASGEIYMPNSDARFLDGQEWPLPPLTKFCVFAYEARMGNKLSDTTVKGYQVPDQAYSIPPVRLAHQTGYRRTFDTQIVSRQAIRKR